MIKKYVMSTYETTDPYREIQVWDKCAKVKIEPSDDGVTRMVFVEKKRNPYVFCIEDGALTIKPRKIRWYNSLIIGIKLSEIRLSVPQTELDTISVSSSVGSVDISRISCGGSINVKTNTGRVNIENVSCRSFESKGNTGSVSLNGFTAKESISVERNTGKVVLNDCFAPEISVKTNTGSVSGKLPSNTVFTTRTNTGKIEIPSPTIGDVIGGRCDVKTNTGSIKFE